MVGKGDRQIGGRLAHHAEHEFILLGPVPARGHVVHRTVGGHQERQQSRDEPLGQQKMVRLEALIRIRECVAFIQNQHLVEQGRAGAPMTDDKQGSFLDRRAGHAPAVESLLHITQDGVAETNHRGNGGNVPAGPVHGEAIAGQQAQPGEEIAALPNAGHPFLLARRSACFGGVFEDSGCHSGICPERPLPVSRRFVEPRGSTNRR